MVRGNSQGAKGSVEKAEFALRCILAESAYLQKKCWHMSATSLVAGSKSKQDT